LKLQQAVGAGVVLLLLAAVAWVLLMSGRTVGRGVTIQVEMKTPACFTWAARCGWRAGRSGKSAHGRRPRSPRRDRAFVLRSFVNDVHKNSQLYVATPSVLGEAYLEIGPPANQAEPGRRSPTAIDCGADRPRSTTCSRTRAEPEADPRAPPREPPRMEELLTAGDELLGTLSGLPADRGQLGRIRDQFVSTLDSGSSAAQDRARSRRRSPASSHRARSLGHRRSNGGPSCASWATS